MILLSKFRSEIKLLSLSHSQGCFVQLLKTPQITFSFPFEFVIYHYLDYNSSITYGKKASMTIKSFLSPFFYLIDP